MSLQSIKYKRGNLEILDQLLLPLQTRYVKVHGVEDGWKAINKMQVRGAPAIAIVGCLSLAIELLNDNSSDKKIMRQEIEGKLNYLVSARPTAVNIKQAAEELISLANTLSADDVITPDEFKERFITSIEGMLTKDIEDNKAIGKFGCEAILKTLEGDGQVRLLTHCNTGSLATAGYGTALGVVRALHQSKRLEHVYCTETRPYNQGARLTAYELVHEKIPATLIVDSMVSALMRTRKITAVVVGADRVAANGDTANKIGTYQIAIVAKYHEVPFYVAAPLTSIDMALTSGDRIKIEERPDREMTHIGEHRIAAPGIKCWNPAFDVTPANLITGIITEKGKVNSIFGVAEAMMPLVYAPMYTTVYTATIKNFPGAFFLLGGGLTVPAVVIFLWLYLANKKYVTAQDTKGDGEKTAPTEEKSAKHGIENKAFEDDKDKSIRVETMSSNNDTDNVNQSQIEMGITESMACTNKL